MCALSAIEYDGLPLPFYVDMAKQCWDEARHSLAFLELARKLRADHDSATQHGAGVGGELFNSEEAFVVPSEGNFYESMLNADLVQRLVLMNQRSEAPAIPLIAKRLASAFCQAHETVAEFYEFDRVDETSHAGIGIRWLRYLVPDEATRNGLTEEADLLRGILILTTFAHHGGGELTDLAVHFSQ